MRVPAIAIFTALTAFAGCGGSISSNPGQPLIIQPGNWSITAASAVSPGGPFGIGGSLLQSGNTVSGILHITSGCFDLFTDIPVNGTVSGQKITLTSPVVVGEVLTVNASASSPTALSGTYNLVANGPSCGTNDQGTFTAVLVPSISGTWHGSFISQVNAGTTIDVTADITQSATPDEHGFFPVSGTVSFSGSPCFTAGNIVSIPLPSFINGSVLSLNIETDDQPTPGLTVFNATADIPATATAMTGNYGVLIGNCATDNGTGHVTQP